MLKIQGVTKSVPHSQTHAEPLTILHDVNLEVAAGESLAIVGASGSGKSTLLGIMAGLDLPTIGDVILGGECLTQMDEDERAAIRANLVGFVFQSFQLLPGLTALENVMLPLELHGNSKAKSMAMQLLDRVGLGERLHHQPSQLSGGEQQRVAIARAFASEPKILFADEPTGNLDSKTGHLIEDLLFQLNEETGATLVMVTHDETLAKRCSRQVQISDGHLAEITSQQPRLGEAI